ncbi:SUMF1/EgtB/PvdO family nonheme iron enzyme [Lentisphaera profundi]|uniref:SUMF1/EgtB/PvdO family nonheme iron enzyme n=1 Tax=Lentisphaera profundi TaxID=1658616 RepID=A0ABY7VTV1_9BACT|nr:SUMF1/EgtB/PvdO family nonheme iron enzyme [Lentisphaera profundi]WDE97641.1 SUMF1/EgtB/PvdO family nonheme iron enzyme [Lentisphaera profundi]
MYLKKFLSLNAIAIASAFASDYQKDIKPIFDKHCIICHGATASAGGYQLHTKYKAFAKGANGVRIVPGKADLSSVYTMCTLDKSNPKTMPPAVMPRLSQNELTSLKNWINEGAIWPNATKQKSAFVKTLSSASGEREITSASQLYKALNFDKKAGQALTADKPYTVYKGAEYEFTMMPIPAGKYKRGSDQGDESPVKEIAIASFWMGKHEVTWAEYESWQFDLDIERRTADNFTMNNLDKNADIVSRPTGPYLDMSFGMGKEKRPVICMTQLAAKAYCMWLSAKTGDFYRLPTEAEWEYACRAGSTSAYSFGDDASKLGDYAWFADNANESYQPIGQKKANAWGLHDMHGNVSEWVLDSFDPDFYANSPSENPVNLAPETPEDNPFEETEFWPNKIYDRIVRGGSYINDADELRSAKRFISEPDWKIQDPQIPKSVWYHTDAVFVGFRVVRAGTIPKLEDLHKYWPTDAEIKAIPKRGE